MNVYTQLTGLLQSVPSNRVNVTAAIAQMVAIEAASSFDLVPLQAQLQTVVSDAFALPLPRMTAAFADTLAGEWIMDGCFIA